MRRALEWLGGSCLVYAALAACSGAAASTDIAPEPGAGGSAVATSGQPSSGGAASTEAGKASSSSGAGGLFDPVPPAMAAAGNGAGGGAVAGAADYDKKTVACDQTIRVGATNNPAAILNLDPPSLITAGRIIAVSGAETFPGWLTVAPGSLTKPDGSQVAALCSADSPSVTFFVPR